MRVSILAFPDTILLEVTGVLDAFAEVPRVNDGKSPYELEIIGIDAEPISGSSGARLMPDRTIADPDHAIDTLLVAGSYAIDEYGNRPEVKAWLVRHATKVRRFGAICHGAFALAAAGLLDGKHVTTHWDATERLATTCPKAIVEPDKIFIRDGHLYSSAGVSSGIDLALAMIEEDLGHKVALGVARRLVLFLKRPGGQSQYSAYLAAEVAIQPAIRKVEAWVLENLRAKCTIDRLAQRAGMSRRSFTRLFRQETHLTPADFVELARLDEARRLLENKALSSKQVAARAGFGSAAGMRRAFQRRLGTTPQEYRQRFEPGPLLGPK
ncbi:MAG TPA: helix-turn-helix domain-containing protein [Alphaproteobacteria bacterium]|nr:helix-turn-helix domain-containing protein [Alphaproteobacteria bacterium]